MSLDFLDDDAFEVDLDAGLPEEGKHYGKILSGQLAINEEKNNSRTIVLRFELNDETFSDFIWLGNSEGVNRDGNLKFAQLLTAVLNEKVSGKLNLRDERFGLQEVEEDGDTKYMFSCLEDAPVKITVKHYKNKKKGILEPQFAFSSAADD